MRNLNKHFSDTSMASSSIVEEANRQVQAIKDIIGMKDQNEESFCRALSEKLGVNKHVIEVMMSLEEMAAMRKKTSIMNSLEECKSRIISVLEDCDEDENIPWGPNDDPEKLIKEAHRSEHILPFMNTADDMTDAMKRKKEQSQFMASIERYIQSCKTKVMDMQELIEWMSNFSFEVTWDEVGMSPVLQREKTEGESYRQMVQALQKAWQCARKFQQLIDLLATDDPYDVISGNLPPHIAAARRKRKGAATLNKLWCSRKLRGKLDEYEKMRIKMEESEKKSMNDQHKSAKVVAMTTQRQVTVVAPGEDSGSSKNPYKETESTILREINRCWKEATDDVVFFMQEVKTHRFSKKSCRLRLDRAMLLLEFIRAAIEGRILDAEQKEKMLEDTKAHVARLQDETYQLNTKLAEAHKATQTAQRKITKLKRQLELVTKNNHKLQTRIGQMKDKITEQMKQIEELQELPNQQEFEENLQKIEDLEQELNNAENQINEVRVELEERNRECNVVKGLLVQEKEMSASLSEDIVVLEQENAKAQVKIAEIEKKMSEQESNVMSLRLMVYYKDEVIRRLKQAAIELKSSEKSRRAPKKPPPSPEDVSPLESKESIGTKDTIKDQKPKVEVVQTTESTADSNANKQETKAVVSKVNVKVPTEGQQSEPLSKLNEFPLLQPQPSVDVCTRLYQGVPKRDRQVKTTRVIIVSEDYKKLQNEHDKLIRDMNATKRQLQETRDNFDYKLREGLETERHKSVLESMKTEEDLQFLCFAVKDETMRVQKEMRKFMDSVSEELGSVIGFKGRLCESILPKTGDRTTGGLTTNVNMEFGMPMGFDFMLGGDLGMFGTGEIMQDSGQMMNQMGPMMFGQGMPGMEGLGFGSAQMGPTGLSIAGNNQVEAEQESGGGKNINYWKSLKTALTGPGKSNDAEEKAKENEQILEISDVLAQRRKAREEKRKSIDEQSRGSDASLANTDSVLSNIAAEKAVSSSQEVCKTKSKRFPQPSASVTNEKSDVRNGSMIDNKVQSDSGIKTQHNDETTSHNMEQTHREKCETSEQNNVKELTGAPIINVECGLTTESYIQPSQILEIVPELVKEGQQTEKDTRINQEINEKTSDEDISVKKLAVKPINILLQRSERRASVFVDDKNTSGLGLLMERKRARFGDRRRSSVIPFRAPCLTVDARRPTIFVPEPPKKIKLKGFFGLGPAFDSDLSLKRSEKKLPAPKPKPPPEPEPVKQAEKFVRLISQQVADFLQTVNLNLAEALRKNKIEMASKMEALENEVMQEKVKFKAELAAVKEERDRKSKELKKAQQTLTDIGFGLGSTSKIDVRSSLPQDLIQNLKQAEHDIDLARDRLEKAAVMHRQNADQYQKLQTSVESRVKQVEAENTELMKSVKKEKTLSNELRVHLCNVLKTQKQKLFLSLKSHKHNYHVLDKADGVDGNVKNVALSLLRRSMLYPKESLSLLVSRYCHHVKITDCQQRVRKQITKREQALKKEAIRGAKTSQREMGMLTTFLAGLAMNKELTKVRNAEKKRRLDSERQKLFIKMSLVLHKIKSDRKDLHLIQPTILQVYGTGCGRSHNNTPVIQDFPDLRFLLPNNRTESLPSIKSSGCELHGHKHRRRDFENTILRGRKPPEDLQRLKTTVPHWFPEDSLFCPFSGRSGNVPPTNSHASIGRSHRENGFVEKSTAASYYQSSATRIEIPRIMELSIQSGLREAKKSVLRRLQIREQSSISSFSTTTNSPISESASLTSITRHYNTPIAQHQMKYERYIWQNVETLGKFTINDNTGLANSTESFCPSRQCPLPPIPTPPATLMGERRSSPHAVVTLPSVVAESESAYDFVATSESSSSLSMRSSNRTTPGLPN
uniref:uncharacterized protein LOC120347749 n=1 Tax=Styela clava TaxID=7725 RepID=UPI0019392B59|nr:uncharacterized protein LOC120347749 [Styela clava]